MAMAAPPSASPQQPQPQPQQQPPHQRSPWAMFGWRLALFALVLFGVNYWLASRATEQPPRVRIPYSPLFLNQVRTDNVARITSKGTAVQGLFKDSVKYQKSKPSKRFKTEVPAFANTDALSKLLQEHNVVINAEPLDTGTPWWEGLLFGFGPTLLLLGLLVFAMRRAGGGAGGVLSAFGRSKARRYEPTSARVTFADVAGIDEAKAELAEIVDFLKSPDRYRRLGGRIPRGVLLSGPPGTGKTLLARAVAGEADVPFFSLSASEFIEIVVGVGASRVRDLFAQAKQAAPAIIFIDELDAIGRSRSAAVSGFGGSDEREQTLNQILTEMDGFDSSTSVIVLAATNRPDVLDPALLRPGRFDRRVTVQPPDRLGREKILEVHTRGVPLGADVDLDRIASATPGMVGADLANLVNEAALVAARRGHDAVAEQDFEDALEKIILGAERKIMMSLHDRERTAYHEGGHAIVGMLTPGADPVRRVTIIPRGLSLGVTISTPEADRFSYEESYLRARIRVALGGRAAEEVVYDEPTTGAESDIQQLTEIARQMVGRWGMSEAIGPIAVLPQDGQGPFLPGAAEASARTQELIDQEVRRIVDEAHEEVTALLREHRDKLDSLARELVERETLDEEEAYAAAGVRRPTPTEAIPAPA
jgi:cell division protease FtsH